MLLEESKNGPEILLIPALQEQFKALFQEESDANLDDINWETVVKNWDLPLKVTTSAKNPHRPGDFMRRKLADYEQADAEVRYRLTARWLLRTPGVKAEVIDEAFPDVEMTGKPWLM
jgi:hypothetical protein